jgi:hypothetical protein
LDTKDTPYYYVTSANPVDPSEPPSSSDVTFTKLWAILDDNRVDFYACGHSHLYSRKTIDSSIAPNPQTDPPRPPWQNNVVQLLNGTSGAGVDTSPPTVDPALWHVFNALDTYYFSVVDISGSLVTVNSYSGNTGAYTVFDSFIQSNPPATELALLASMNQPTFGVGQTATAAVGVVDPGLPVVADFYTGVLFPDGQTIAFVTSTGTVTGRLADLTSFRPFAAGVLLAAPFNMTTPNFFSYHWTGTEDHGDYVFFVFAMKSGPLTPGGLLGLATAPFSFRG